MTDATPSPDAPTEDELFFEKAEYDGAGPACAACQRGLGDEHYLIQGTEVCSDCTAKIRESLAAQPALPVRVILATLGGAVAAALSAAVWYGIRVLTGYEIGLIAIAAGFLVALAVRTGAAGNGGLWARFVALFFTYSAIAWSYIPDVMGAIADGEEIDGPIAYVLLAVIAFVVSYVAPILSLMDAGAIFAVANLRLRLVGSLAGERYTSAPDDRWADPDRHPAGDHARHLLASRRRRDDRVRLPCSRRLRGVRRRPSAQRAGLPRVPHPRPPRPSPGHRARRP